MISRAVRNWVGALAAMSATMSTGVVLARPSGTGDCVAFSEKDMKGKAFPVSAAQDPTAVSAKLPFVARSFFLAEGFAVKAFEQEDFKGLGEFDGSAIQATDGSVARTDGGYTFNIGHFYISDGANSFACVQAGKVWTDLADFPNVDRFLYLPGQKLVTDGNVYHGPFAEVSLDEQDGHKVLRFRSGSYVSLTRQGTLDFDTGVIVIEQVDYGRGRTVVSRQEIHRHPEVNGIDLEYAAAARLIADSLKLLIVNPSGAGPHSRSVVVPHLELQQVYDLVASRTYGI